MCVELRAKWMNDADSEEADKMEMPPGWLAPSWSAIRVDTNGGVGVWKVDMEPA